MNKPNDDRRESYMKKLRDPRWQKIRLKILERDKWACVMCGREDETLHVHHRMYIRGREPWEYDESLLVTLCEECHESEGASRREIEDELLCFLRKNFFSNDVYELIRMLGLMPIVHLPEVQFSALTWYLSNADRVKKIVDEYLTRNVDRVGSVEQNTEPSGETT